MNDLLEIIRLTAYYVWHLALWFALAISITALVDLLYLDILARRGFRRKGWLGVVLATSIGAFSPFCSFVVIPLIRRLLAGGVPLSAVMAFWVASPTMDPEIFGMTAAQIGIPLAMARLIGALMMSLGAGFLVLLMERRGMLSDVLRPGREADEREGATPSGQSESQCQRQEEPALVATPARGSAGATDAPAPTGATAAPASASGSDEDDDPDWWPAAKASLRSARNWKITLRNMGRDVISLGKWLLLACFIEALVVMYVPNELIAGLFGDNPLLAIPLAALVGVPLYMNGVGAIPVVDAMLIKGMAPGGAVTFLLGGAVTTVPAIAAVRAVVTNRVFLTYLGVSVIGSVLVGYLAQIVLG